MDAISYSLASSVLNNANATDTNTSNLDNTSDVSKPISTAQQTSIDNAQGALGTKDFVASGALTNGDVVSLNTDGTVSVAGAASIDPVAGSSTDLFDSSSVRAISIADNKILVWEDTAFFIGTITGSSISFGSSQSTTFACSDVYATMVYVPTDDKVLITYYEGGVGTRVAVLDVDTGTDTITVGNTSTLTTANNTYPRATYYTTEDRVLYCFDYLSGVYARAVSVIAGVLVLGTSEAGWSMLDLNYLHYNSVADKAIIVYSTTTTNRNICGITIDNYSCTFESQVTFDTFSSGKSMFAFSSILDRYLYLSLEISNTTVRQFELVSGTPTVYSDSTISINGDKPLLTFDTISQQYLLAFSDDLNSSRATIVTIKSTSTTSVVVGNFVVPDSEYTYSLHSLVFDEGSDSHMLIVYNGFAALNEAIAISTFEYTTDRWLGVSNSTVTDAQTAQIALLGKEVTNQTGLTPQAKYYVDTDGSLTTTDTGYYIGRATSATSLLIEGSI